MILWKTKFHYTVNTNLSLDPVLSLIIHYFKIHYNIIFMSMPRSGKWPLLVNFQIIILFSFLIPFLHISYRLFYQLNIWRRVKIMKILLVHFSKTYSYLLCFRFKNSQHFVLTFSLKKTAFQNQLRLKVRLQFYILYTVFWSLGF